MGVSRKPFFDNFNPKYWYIKDKERVCFILIHQDFSRGINLGKYLMIYWKPLCDITMRIHRVYGLFWNLAPLALWLFGTVSRLLRNSFCSVYTHFHANIVMIFHRFRCTKSYFGSEVTYKNLVKIFIGGFHHL